MKIVKIGLIVVGLVIVAMVVNGFIQHAQFPSFGDRDRAGSDGQSKQSSSSSSLESSKQYLRENGIDCTHENTNSTHGSLTVDPKNPTTIYVGVEGRGVFKSTDKGATWARKDSGIVVYPDSNDKTFDCYPDLSDIVIDPTDSDHLWLVASDITTGYVDWPYGETGGIWESRDGAESWSQLLPQEVNAAGSGMLLVDPTNPKVLYYPANPDPPTFKEAPIKTGLMKDGSVYKSVDGGKSWDELTMPMLPGLQALRLFIDPADSNHLRFMTQSHDHVYHDDGSITEVFLEQQHGVLESLDGGKSWNSWADRFPTPYGAMFDGDIAPGNFDHLIVRPFLFGETFKPETTKQKSFYSTDGGKTFALTDRYIWVGRYDPHDSAGNHLLGYASENRQVVESTDGGKSWTKTGTPAEVASGTVKLTEFVWDPTDANVVYLSGDRGTVWRSTDSGKNWTKLLSLETLPT